MLSASLPQHDVFNYQICVLGKPYLNPPHNLPYEVGHDSYFTEGGLNQRYVTS